MKKQFIAVLLTLTVVSGCGIMNYIPEDYDGNEFMKLAELSVLSEMSDRLCLRSLDPYRKLICF